jgi:hypothetical protein
VDTPLKSDWGMPRNRQSGLSGQVAGHMMSSGEHGWGEKDWRGGKARLDANNASDSESAGG